MAKAYRVRSDVSIPKVTATHGEGRDAVHDVQGVNYVAGSVVLAEHMTPRDRDRAENGELDHVLEPMGDEELQDGIPAPTGEPEFGIFVAEHEAEAHALEQYGHVVVPNDQVLEAQASGLEYARQYQEAAAQHGLDHRPNQEMMAQPRQRIPDEMLVGAEQRSGVPFNRGPEGFGDSQESENAEGDDGEGSNDSESPSPRQRPGSGATENAEGENQSEGQ